MKQGGQPEIEDLDVLITSRSLKPTKVRFGGREWTVKRDFTAAEVVQFWVTIERRSSVDAFAMIVGKRDAADLSAIVESLPTEMAMVPLRRMYQIAGVLARPNDTEEPEGESSASSQES